MTAKVRDPNGGGFTEFSNWIRTVDALKSSDGYIATNVDFMWRNYKTGEWMLIEEKRHGSRPAHWQMQCFQTIDKACSSDPNYLGFYLVVFENTLPTDGWVEVVRVSDGLEWRPSADQFVRWLSFKRWTPPIKPTTVDMKEQIIASRYD